MIIRIRQTTLYLAQRVTTGPWPAFTVVVAALFIALGWPNVIYGLEGIPMGTEAA